MARLEFKVPISVSKFPFDYAKASRAILRPELDVVSRAPVSFAGSNESMDHNVIQLLHCQNVMPVDTGLKSPGYWQQAAPSGTVFFPSQLLDGSIVSTQISPIRHLANTGGGTIGTAWANPSPFASDQYIASISVVDRRCFVQIAGPGVGTAPLYEHTPDTSTFTARAVTMPGGYTASAIQRMVGVGNYHVASYTTSSAPQQILWSTITDPTNFADVTSGAGRAIPNVSVGIWTALVPLLDGFLIVGTTGIIAASVTGDASRPFVFRLLPGIVGAARIRHSVRDNATLRYAYTDTGIYKIALQRAEQVHVDASDYITHGRTVTTFTGNPLTVAVGAKAAGLPVCDFLDNRYLTLRSSETAQGGFIFDTQLQRWGKLDFLPNFICDTTHSGKLISVLSTGRAYSVRLDLVGWGGAPSGSVIPFGLVVFGHVKGTRGRKITFQEAIVDGNGLFTYATLLPSTPGFTRDAGILLYAVSDGFMSHSYHGRYTGDNFDLALSGDLDLTTLLISVTQHGSR